MHLTQMDTGPFTFAVSIPVEGAQISALLTADGEPTANYRYIKIDAFAPATEVDRDALLFTTRRPGATALVAEDWDHAKTIPAGVEYELPFDHMIDAFLKPVGVSPCLALIIAG